MSNTPTPTPTTEQHTDRLMAEVDYEIDRYGLPALADTIGSILAARCGDDADERSAEQIYYHRARLLFGELRDRLLQLPPVRQPARPELLLCTRCGVIPPIGKMAEHVCRCPSRLDESGVRCGKPAGHDGAHADGPHGMGRRRWN